MTDYECYCEYVALKLHFTNQTYDYHKYAGQTASTTVGAFEKRKDKHFFVMLSRSPDPTGRIISILINNSKAWIRDITSRKGEEIYESWNKYRQSLAYNFKSELAFLEKDFNSNFMIVDHYHPVVMRLYLAKKISFETFSILVNLSNCTKHWDEKMKDDPVWEDLRGRSIKYLPFLNIDEKKFKEIVREQFKS